jgi:TonB family protein
VRILVILLCLVVPIASQETTQASKPPCIAADESVYKMGGDVKPAQPQPDKNAKNAPDIKGSMILELLVNAQGQVCDAKVLTASNRLSAEKTASFIREHWSFKPATKEGNPVAVQFTMTFNNPR